MGRGRRGWGGRNEGERKADEELVDGVVGEAYCEGGGGGGWEGRRAGMKGLGRGVLGWMVVVMWWIRALIWDEGYDGWEGCEQR